MRIYTKTGDQGKTGLLGGKRISKSQPRIAAIGDIDELNAIIGVVLSFEMPKKEKIILERVQENLFIIGANLASPKKNPHVPVFPEKETEKLEKEIDNISEKLPELRNFILPGGSKSASLLHLARAVCRRAERSIVKIFEKEKNLPDFIPYINRLSDYLFVLALSENKRMKVKETVWKGLRAILDKKISKNTR